jgi:hypothetical protein
MGCPLKRKTDTAHCQLQQTKQDFFQVFMAGVAQMMVFLVLTLYSMMGLF